METELERARKEIEYYKKIAERTGNLYLRETEELSKIITRLKQTETSLMKSEQKIAILSSTVMNCFICTIQIII